MIKYTWFKKHLTSIACIIDENWKTLSLEAFIIKKLCLFFLFFLRKLFILERKDTLKLQAPYKISENVWRHFWSCEQVLFAECVYRTLPEQGGHLGTPWQKDIWVRVNSFLGFPHKKCDVTSEFVCKHLFVAFYQRLIILPWRWLQKNNMFENFPLCTFQFKRILSSLRLT